MSPVRPAGADDVGGPTQLVRLLRDAGDTLAVAESLTGGAVSASVVDVPGASAVLRGGVVAYATDLKAQLLGVAPALLAAHGAVHPDVAAAMAEGVRGRLGATWGVATTGVAGPDPQDGRPPGEFHVAVAGPRGTVVRSVVPTGSAGPTSRSQVRAAARDAALTLLLDVLVDDPSVAGDAARSAEPTAGPDAHGPGTGGTAAALE